MSCASCGEGLCQGCTNRLGAQLRNIPWQYGTLRERYPSLSAMGSENAGGRSSPMLVSAGMLDLMLLRIPYGDATLDGVDSLEGWCRIVIEERAFHWPAPLDSVWGRLANACRFLNTHVQWISRQGWCFELADETWTIDRALRKALDPYREHIKTGLLCPGSPGEPCGATLWQDRTDPAQPTIGCRICGATWEAEAWPVLAERLDLAVPIRAVEAFVLGRNPYRRVQKWVQLGVIANHGTDGAPRVRLAEVLDAQRRQPA